MYCFVLDSQPDESESESDDERDESSAVTADVEEDNPAELENNEGMVATKDLGGNDDHSPASSEDNDDHLSNQSTGVALFCV